MTAPRHPIPSHLAVLVALPLSLIASGCWVAVPLDGLACDSDHPCVDDHRCVLEVCEPVSSLVSCRGTDECPGSHELCMAGYCVPHQDDGEAPVVETAPSSPDASSVSASTSESARGSDPEVIEGPSAADEEADAGPDLDGDAGEAELPPADEPGESADAGDDVIPQDAGLPDDSGNVVDDAGVDITQEEDAGSVPEDAGASADEPVLRDEDAGPADGDAGTATDDDAGVDAEDAGAEEEPDAAPGDFVFDDVPPARVTLLDGCAPATAVAANPTGLVVLASRCGSGAEVRVVVSHDGGLAFELANELALAEAPVALEVATAASAVYVAWTTSAGLTLVASEDAGETFAAPRVVAPNVYGDFALAAAGASVTVAGTDAGDVVVLTSDEHGSDTFRSSSPFADHVGPVGLVAFSAGNHVVMGTRRSQGQTRHGLARSYSVLGYAPVQESNVTGDGPLWTGAGTTLFLHSGPGARVCRVPTNGLTSSACFVPPGDDVLSLSSSSDGTLWTALLGTGTDIALQRTAPGTYSASHTMPLVGATDATVSAHDGAVAVAFARDSTTWFAAFANPE